MQNLKIGFSVSTLYRFPVVSWLIRIFEGGWYHSSHVFFEIPVRCEDKLCNYILEASMLHGVHLRLANDFYKEVKVNCMYEITTTEDQEQAVMDWGRKYTGTPYGIKQLVGDAIHKVLRIFGMKRNPFRDGTETMVCSETLARVCDGILGMKIPIDLDTIGVKDIQKVLDAHIASTATLKIVRLK